MCKLNIIKPLVWVSKIKPFKWNARPSHHYTLQYILKHKKTGNNEISLEAVFSVVIITIPSLSNIHQNAAFYQKPYKPNKKDIYNHKEIDKLSQTESEGIWIKQ